MFTYSFIIWIFIFYIYCFLGWIVESSIVSVRTRKLVNRGFLKIPMLPIYGFGAVMMLFVSLPIKDKPILIYFAGMIAATLLEYIAAVLIENIFKIKYCHGQTFRPAKTNRANEISRERLLGNVGRTRRNPLPNP